MALPTSLNQWLFLGSGAQLFLCHASWATSSSVIVTPARTGGKGLGILLLTSAGRFPVLWEQREGVWLMMLNQGSGSTLQGQGVGQGMDYAGNLPWEWESFPEWWVSANPRAPPVSSSRDTGRTPPNTVPERGES